MDSLVSGTEKQLMGRIGVVGSEGRAWTLAVCEVGQNQGREGQCPTGWELGDRVPLFLN